MAWREAQIARDCIEAVRQRVTANGTAGDEDVRS